MLADAVETIALLPPEETGRAVLDEDGSLFEGSRSALESALSANRVIFHAGSIRGALPVVVEMKG